MTTGTKPNTGANVRQAIDGLHSQAVPEQEKAARLLAEIAPDDQNRSQALHDLEPHLQEPQAKRRLVFVKAYANWATKAQVPILQHVLETPTTVEGITDQEKPWSAAAVRLVELDPQAAADAMNTRLESLFFRTDLIRDLKPLTQVNGPISPLAQHFIDQLHAYRKGVSLRPEP